METISIVSDIHIQSNTAGFTLSEYYMCDNTLYTYDYDKSKYVLVDKYVDFLMKEIDISKLQINMKDTVHNPHDLIVDKENKRFYYKTDTLYDEFLSVLLCGGTCLLFSHIFVNYKQIDDDKSVDIPYSVKRMMNKNNGYQTLFIFEYETEYPILADTRDLLMFEKNFV